MKPRIDPQAMMEQSAYDLLQSTSHSPKGNVAILEDLLKALPLMDGEVGSLDSAVIGSRPGMEKAALSPPGIRDCLTELAHHLDKRRVIEEALSIVRSVQAKGEYLAARQEEAARVFRGLDVRTRAILDIQQELSAVDGIVNTRMCEAVHDIGEVDPEGVLSGDPELRSLLECYAMAKEVNEYERRLWRREAV